MNKKIFIPLLFVLIVFAAYRGFKTHWKFTELNSATQNIESKINTGDNYALGMLREKKECDAISESIKKNEELMLQNKKDFDKKLSDMYATYESVFLKTVKKDTRLTDWTGRVQQINQNLESTEANFTTIYRANWDVYQKEKINKTTDTIPYGILNGDSNAVIDAFVKPVAGGDPSKAALFKSIKYDLIELVKNYESNIPSGIIMNVDYQMHCGVQN